MIGLAPAAFSDALRDAGDGRWLAPTSGGEVRYPDNAHAALAAVEGSSFWFGHRRDVLLTVMRRLPPSGPVVDVGGGNGFMTAALRQAGYPALLLEPGPAGVAEALRRDLAPVIQATFDQAAFREGSLAAVTLFDVLEHIADDGALLQAVSRALVADGRLYVTVPASQLLWSASDEIAGHVRRYSPASLRRRLQLAGLTIEWLGGFFVPLWPVVALTRALPHRLWRRRTTVAAEIDAHRTNDGLALRGARAALRAELRLITAGVRPLIGASLLAVARRDQDR